MTPQAALQRVIEHREIFHDEMVSLMRQIMSGEVTPVMIAAIITGLRVKKETIGEIAAAATVMRELSTKVVVPYDRHFVDIVGTGGDAAHTFNISTASMFVVAAAGGKVAKHGGRSVSSSSGSADVLEALGANLDDAAQRYGKPVLIAETAYPWSLGWADAQPNFVWQNSQLLPGFEAPVYMSWARRNRSDLIRIPEYKPGRETHTRIEYRSPDPACNPYLAFAVMLAAGLDGIENERQLPPPVEENVFELAQAEREQRGIKTLPGSLMEAIEVAEASPFLRSALGDHVHESLIKNKKIEWERYRRHISDFELSEYLPIL